MKGAGSPADEGDMDNLPGKILRVAVVGGGPSGTAAAIRLAREGRKRKIPVEVLLFEGKDFDVHYNQCVGVLSPPIESILLDKLGIDLPLSIFKRHIRGYRLHAGGKEILLVGESRLGPTFAVRRVHFDAFMLRRAEEAGVKVYRSRVSDLDFLKEGRRREVLVFSEAGTFVVDFVVGAFGLDEGSMALFERATGRYRRPSRYMTTYITKIHVERGFIEKRLGDIIYAFLYPDREGKFEFGAITPKGDHIIVNAAGKRVSVEDFLSFLDMPEVRDHLPPVSIPLSQIFKGKFPSSPARGVTGPSYLVVGDGTGFLRPLKGKGITTGVLTGIYCADAILDHVEKGTPLSAYEVRCRELVRDYFYGTIVKTAARVGDAGGFLGSLIELAKVERELYEALFNAVSGQETFRKIVRENLRLKTAASLVKLWRREREKG
ncbi:MAG: NAD(P)/FAD-dependent oxidoreductase [Deltaproteobacteria bacterium]|nr:MAG: NAD(P)/FAD-dependent oxidoreductase [Deltaproteobacteria bacterium]